MKKHNPYPLRRSPPQSPEGQAAVAYYVGWRSPIKAPHLINNEIEGWTMRCEPSVLTERERLIFWYVAAGWRTKAIAAHLNISQRTVEIHRAHIKESMPGAPSAAQIAALAVQLLADGVKIARQTATRLAAALSQELPPHDDHG